MSNRKHFGINEHGILSWIAAAPDVQAHDTGTPTYAISGYRFYGNSSTVDNGTAIAAEDTAIIVGNDGTQDVAFDTIFIIRLQYDETNLGEPGNYNHTIVTRGTNWSLGIPSTGTAQPVEPAAATWTDGDATTQLLANAPSGSFTFGVGLDSGGNYINAVNIAQDDYGEYHVAVLITRTGKTTPPGDGDTFEFGITNEGTGTTVWTGNVITIAYTATSPQSGDAGLATSAFAGLGATGTAGEVSGTAGLASAAFAALGAVGTVTQLGTAGLASAAWAALGADGTPGAVSGTAGLATFAAAALGAVGSQLNPIRLRDSSFIANGDPTTKQLSTPSGKVAGDFESGDIIEATSTALHNIGDRKFTEIETSLELTSAAPVGFQYLIRHRRVGVANIALDPGCEIPCADDNTWSDVTLKSWFRGPDHGTYHTTTHDTVEKYQGSASHKITVDALGGDEDHHYAIWKLVEAHATTPNGEYHGGAWVKGSVGETIVIRVVRRVGGVDQYSGVNDSDSQTTRTASGSWEWVPVYLDTWGGAGTTDAVQIRVGLQGPSATGKTINVDGVILGRTYPTGWVDIPTGPTAWITVAQGTQTGTAGLATFDSAALGATGSSAISSDAGLASAAWASLTATGTPGLVTGTAGLASAAFASLTAIGSSAISTTAGLSSAAFASLSATSSGAISTDAGLASASFAALGTSGSSAITTTAGLSSASFAALGAIGTNVVTGVAGRASAAFASLSATGTPGAVTTVAGLSDVLTAALGATGTPGTATGTAGVASASFAGLTAVGSNVVSTTAGIASASFAALTASGTAGEVTGTAGLASSAFAALEAIGSSGVATTAGLATAAFASLSATGQPGALSGTAGLATAAFVALGATGSKTTPTCTQERYQWRADDGTEITASNIGGESSPFNAAVAGTTYRLRVQIDADEGDPDAAQFRLEYRRKGIGADWNVVG